MEFRTKFNPGEEVWFMQDNRPQKMQIEVVSVGATEHFRYKTEYYMHTGSISKLKKYENEIFATKQELIESL